MYIDTLTAKLIDLQASGELVTEEVESMMDTLADAHAEAVAANAAAITANAKADALVMSKVEMLRSFGRSKAALARQLRRSFAKTASKE